MYEQKKKFMLDKFVTKLINKYFSHDNNISQLVNYGWLDSLNRLSKYWCKFKLEIKINHQNYDKNENVLMLVE